MARLDRYAIGEGYGGSAASNGPSGLIEWEWVHAGREFARSHPAGKMNLGVFAVMGYVAIHGAVSVYAGIRVGGALHFLFAINCACAVLAMWKKSLMAWPLVWISLAKSFPFSLPAMWYWADGVRPNLIYRHRFERLVEGGDANVQ
jgi:hypothetical protein